MVENYQDRKKVLIVCLGYVFRQSQYKLKKKCYGRGDGVKKKKKITLNCRQIHDPGPTLSFSLLCNKLERFLLLSKVKFLYCYPVFCSTVVNRY